MAWCRKHNNEKVTPEFCLCKCSNRKKEIYYRGKIARCFMKNLYVPKEEAEEMDFFMKKCQADTQNIFKFRWKKV